MFHFSIRSLILPFLLPFKDQRSTSGYFRYFAKLFCLNCLLCLFVFSSLGPTLPVLFFPAVMAVAHDNEDEKYFGLDAFAPEVRNRCQLRHPMIPSRTVNKFSIDPIALQGILEKIFKVFRQGLGPCH